MPNEQALENRERKEMWFRLYAITLGLLAATVTAHMVLLDLEVLKGQVLPVAVFTLFICFSWYFSVPVSPRSSLSISLDMAYLMTALCVLPPPLPVVVAFAGATFGCYLRGREGRPRRNPFLIVLGLNTGGMVATALACGALPSLLGRFWQFHVLDWGTVLSITALFLAYHLTNLVVMTVAMALKGEPVLRTLAGYLAYIPTIEVFTIPLCLGLTLLYTAAGIWGFLPLGTTILLASALLKNLNLARNDLTAANDQLQNRTRELRILNTIGREINSDLDPEKVFGKVSAHLQMIFDAPFLFLSQLHRLPQHQYAEYVARHGEVLPRPERALGEGFTAWMVEAKRPLLVSDLAVDWDSLQCAPVILDPSVRSIMAAPLVFAGDAIGVLCVASPKQGAYSVDQLSVFQTVAQQTAVAIENARNYQMATVDQLTKLYLRDFFSRKLAEEQARARRYGSTFAVLMMDLDYFKDVNDRLGHLAGDRFLNRVGEAIRETMRAADIACRYGGEEFCALLPETDLQGAVTIAERIRTRIANLEVRMGDSVIRTTISVGIACYPADYPGTIQGLLEKADQVLYTAKQRGRNRVVTTAARSNPVSRHG